MQFERVQREKSNKPHKGKAMGSSGSGNFSDYPGTKASDVTGDGTGTAGGTSGVDKCKKAFDVLLDDVGNSDFFSKFNNVPAVGDQLSILFDGKRVFAIDENGVKVGALPTSFNYLVACLEDGVTYVGVVSTSAVSPVPTVAADFTSE
jgi:hypothetical protein